MNLSCGNTMTFSNPKGICYPLIPFDTHQTRWPLSLPPLSQSYSGQPQSSSGTPKAHAEGPSRGMCTALPSYSKRWWSEDSRTACWGSLQRVCIKDYDD